MKKLVLIFSLVITFLGIFVVAFPYLLKWTGLDQPVKKYLFQKIIQDYHLKIDLSDFKIGLGSVELSNLTVHTQNEQLSIQVKKVRFLYDLMDLITHPTEPLHALSSIAIVEPQITFTRDSVTAAQNSSTTWQRWNQFIRTVAHERGLNFFKVEKAAVFLNNNRQKSITLVSNLDGFFKTNDFNLFKLKVEGDLLGSRAQKIDLTAELNLQRKKLKIFNDFNHFRFTQSELTRFFPQISAFEGVLNGWLMVENVEGDLGQFLCNGQIDFSNGILRVRNTRFSSITGKAIFTDNRLIIDSLQGKLNEASFIGNVQISDIFKPALNGFLEIKNLALGDVQSLINYTSVPSGLQATARLEFEFTPQTKSMELNVRHGTLNSAHQRLLSDLQFVLNATPQKWEIRHVKAKVKNQGLLKAEILVNREQNQSRFTLQLRKKTGQHVIFDGLNQKQHDFEINGYFNQLNDRLWGRWQYALHDSTDSVFAVNGQFVGTSSDLKISVTKSNKKGFAAYLHLSDLFNSWRIENGFVRNFPFERLTSVQLLQQFLNSTSTQLNLSGSLQQKVFTKIAFFNKHKPQDRVEIQSAIDHFLSGRFVIDGLCRLKNLEGRLHLAVSPEKLRGDFNFKNQVSGTVSIDLKKSEYLFSQIMFRDFRVIKALADSIQDDDLRALGSLDGQLIIEGSLNDPRIRGEIAGDRFVFNEIGYYQGNLKFEANKEFIKLDSLLIAINNLPVIQGKGFADIKRDSLQANFKAQEVDVEQLLVTLFKHPPQITGTAAYTLQLQGPVKKPAVSIDLQIKDGFLDRIPFDQLSVLLKNKYQNAQNLLDLEKQRLMFDRFELLKNGRYALNAIGEIPFDPTKNIDVFVNFKGDLLSFIPYYQPFFEKAHSDVELHLAFGGSPEQIRLSSGYLLINSGELWLQNVAKHITNISGVIEKKGDSNQINFINLTGQTGGETLTINTVRNITLTDGRRLQSWYLKDLDLDFGILELTTTGKGVRLHIPGLMVTGDEGRLYLTGMNKHEKFYFAGPLKHPLVHGKVVLYDTRLTFPFIEQGKPGQKPSAVINFLENINWDVLTVSGEDVLYFREIPAYIDNVNTELYIDESSPGLHFTGILSDGSFKVKGLISSSRGRLEYLDQTFRVDYFQAEFTENSPYPIISGQAWTTIRDSIGAVPKTIYLKLYAIDQETKQEKQQGSWENFKFKLVSADPKIGESQEQVLADLGFSVGNIADKVTSVGGAVTEKYLFRPLFRPIERAIERNLGIDMVRFNSNIARNLFYSSIGFGRNGINRSTPLINPFNTETPYLFLMQSSEITLGKYLTQNLFLTYTGQLVSVYDQSRPSFDINHSFGIEYRFLRNILLEIEYDRELMGYYKIQNQKQYLEDIKIRLRHSFTF